MGPYRRSCAGGPRCWHSSACMWAGAGMPTAGSTTFVPGRSRAATISSPPTAPAILAAQRGPFPALLRTGLVVSGRVRSKHRHIPRGRPAVHRPPDVPLDGRQLRMRPGLCPGRGMLPAGARYDPAQVRAPLPANAPAPAPG